MKLCNAPGRKLARRRGALARFRVRFATIERQRARLNPRTEVVAKAEYAHLVDLCRVTDEAARGARTKKDRTSRAKFGRAA